LDTVTAPAKKLEKIGSRGLKLLLAIGKTLLSKEPVGLLDNGGDGDNEEEDDTPEELTLRRISVLLLATAFGDSSVIKLSSLWMK
jgi:hypothetical protein